jgi:hypothetical protein
MLKDIFLPRSYNLRKVSWMSACLTRRYLCHLDGPVSFLKMYNLALWIHGGGTSFSPLFFGVSLLIIIPLLLNHLSSPWGTVWDPEATLLIGPLLLRVAIPDDMQKWRPWCYAVSTVQLRHSVVPCIVAVHCTGMADSRMRTGNWPREILRVLLLAQRCSVPWGVRQT